MTNINPWTLLLSLLRSVSGKAFLSGSKHLLVKFYPNCPLFCRFKVTQAKFHQYIMRCSKLHFAILTRNAAFMPNQGQNLIFIYLLSSCKFFHLLYKDGYTNSCRTLQCLYMKRNCDSRAHRWHTHRYLRASRNAKKKNIMCVVHIK